jgi:protein SCO1/2
MDRKLLWVGVGVLLLIAITALVIFIVAQPHQLRGSVIEPALPAAQINLTDQQGQPFHLSDYRGKVVLLFFGYASCPDVCPATMAVLKQARAQLTQSQADRVQVVFITVDPNRDTPQAIQDYVTRFDPTFIGLSGSEADLTPVWQAYGVFRDLGTPNANGFYEVSHTARVYVVDTLGNLSLSFPFGATVDDVTNDLKILLK